MADEIRGCLVDTPRLAKELLDSLVYDFLNTP